jgi:hypothetical protein
MIMQLAVRLFPPGGCLSLRGVSDAICTGFVCLHGKGIKQRALKRSDMEVQDRSIDCLHSILFTPSILLGLPRLIISISN